MLRYRLVDDRDGTVLADLASAERALLLFGRFARDPQRRVRICVVRVDREPGGVAAASRG
jgi:hypothetical protein